jgi:DNA polymerase-1
MKSIPTKPKHVFVDNPELFEMMVKDCWPRKVLYMDTETSGLDPLEARLLLIQVCPGEGRNTYVIDFNKCEKSDIERMKSLFTDKELVLHNAKFDLKFLQVYLGLPISSDRIKVYDTMLAECVCLAGRVVSLRRASSLRNTLYRRYRIDLNKDARQEFIGHDGKHFTQRQIDYAAKDVDVLVRLRKDQIDEAKEFELTNTFKLEFELVKHVATMELSGVEIDVDRWREVISQQIILKRETYERFKAAVEPYLEQQGLFGEVPLKINSQVETLRFLKTRLGLDIEDTKEETLSYANNEICDILLEYREHEKLIKAFGESLLDKISKVTHRLHPDFNQCATATGRFSASNPNVQQIPSRGAGAALRDCFRAAKGCKLVCADYSQIELRILAELSQEPKMINAYRTGYDGHTNTASVAFGVALEDVTGDQRKVAKILNFATVYGGGPKAIAKGMLQVLSYEEAEYILEAKFGKFPDKNGVFYCLAKEFVSSFFQGLPKAQEYLQLCGASAINNRYSETPIGRKRFYDTEFESIKDLKGTDEYEEKLEEKIASVKRRGMNHPIQGCSADITKLAISKLSQDFRDKYPGRARILLQVHDELLVECDEEISEEVAKLQEEDMVWAGEQFLSSVPVLVDVHISTVWEK